MKKRTIFAGLLLSISCLAFSAIPTDPELLKIPSLKALSEKVDALAQKTKEAAVSSRSANQEAQAQLKAAYTEYAAELNKQKELTSNAALKATIDKELQAVNEKIGIATSTQSK